MGEAEILGRLATRTSVSLISALAVLRVSVRVLALEMSALAGGVPDVRVRLDLVEGCTAGEAVLVGWDATRVDEAGGTAEEADGEAAEGATAIDARLPADETVVSFERGTAKVVDVPSVPSEAVRGPEAGRGAGTGGAGTLWGMTFNGEAAMPAGRYRRNRRW
jgi:hypothetical protein